MPRSTQIQSLPAFHTECCRLFGPLQVIKSIGMGQFGRVRLVKSKRTGHSFAMKCLEKRRILELGQTTHIKNEKLCLEQIDHPFIVRLVTTCKDARCVYMVLELCLGGELFTVRCEFKDPEMNEYCFRLFLVLEFL